MMSERPPFGGLFALQKKNRGVRMKKTMQTGRSMIEMLGVLAIIGVISVGGFDMFSKAMNQKKIGEIKSNVTILAMQSRRLACQYAEAYGSYTKMLYRAEAYPEALEVVNPSTSNIKYKGNTGEEYQIASVNDGTKKNAFFKITITQLSDEACLALASENFGSASTNGFAEISINNQKMTSPVSIGSAVAKCNQVKTNKIELKYRACENNAQGIY